MNRFTAGSKGEFTALSAWEGSGRVTGGDPARNTLDTKLLHAGYVDATRDHYQRRYETIESRIIQVAGTFPRLTRGTVPSCISDARYELNLDQTYASGQPMPPPLLGQGRLA